MPPSHIHSDESLAPELSVWKLHPPRDPNFRPTVLARIKGARRDDTWIAYLRVRGAALAAVLLVAAVVGAWAGRSHARERVAAERAVLVADYVHALDARWMRAP